MTQVWLNGNFIDDADAAISIRDTGLLHAAGVFTTMRCANGKVFRLPEHLARIRGSCETLQIPLQFSNDALIAACTELLMRNKLPDARLRLTVTRGIVEEDPLHGMRLRPTAFLTAAAFEPYPVEYYQRGMTVILLDEQKLNPYDVQAGHKTLDYFSRLAGLRAANQRQAGEALWFNVHNYLQSGSISNVFIVKNGILRTPPTQRQMQEKTLAEQIPYPRSNVLPGVTRGAMLDFARDASIEVQFSAIDVNQVLEADEVFITNSIMGVMPVCRIERKVIGNDRPGPITLHLLARHDQLLSPEA